MSTPNSSTWPEHLDALIAAPEHHTLLFESDEVRVLDTLIRPGAQTPIHTHRCPAVLYITSWSQFVRRDAAGSIVVDSRTIPDLANPSSVLWTGPLAAHSLENVGKSDLRVISVELKRAAQPAPLISIMLAVPDAPRAVSWYQKALGAKLLWSLGSVAGLALDGAPFFVGQPERNGWESPATLGMPTARVEVFCEDPDALVARAVEAGADGRRDAVRDHEAPWGSHRQGGFVDPFGHIWLVGDRSPLERFPR